MRISLFNQISALFVLVIFIYTNCEYFSFPEIVPTIHTVPAGLGDVGAVFLDNEYKPTTIDNGILAMFVENNKYTENVMIIAEIPGNHIDNNVTVRIINKENNSLVTFFYNNGQYFPSKMVMTIEEQTITGWFSHYNMLNQTYIVEFRDEDEEEIERFENIVLNKNVFNLHEYSEEITETQNERLQKIYTTLALWRSMALHLDDFDDYDASRAIKINVKKFVVSALTVVAVVALAVAVVPAVVALTGPAAVIVLPAGVPAAMGAISVISTGAALLCNDLIPDDLYWEIGASKHKPSSSEEYFRPKVSITYFDNKLDKLVDAIQDNDLPYYLEQNESITFYFSIDDFGSEESFEDIINITDINKLLKAFDPNYSRYVFEKQANAAYFDYDILYKYGVIQNIEITRNTEGGAYGEGDTIGKVKFILPFKCNVIINEKSKGVEFVNDANTESLIRQDIFIFNFTVIKPVPADPDE